MFVISSSSGSQGVALGVSLSRFPGSLLKLEISCPSLFSPQLCLNLCDSLRALEEKGMAENEMVGWHHQLDGHESE